MHTFSSAAFVGTKALQCHALIDCMANTAKLVGIKDFLLIARLERAFDAVFLLSEMIVFAGLCDLSVVKRSVQTNELC
jgi:hypothetical protein